ncbi:MAG: HD domain-containing protein [Bacteroidota bacterium]|nr:HD domain-containing protein [Bacteroidota bacterium]
MRISKTNKNKIVNDPVFGFINISSEIYFDLIQHPYFQRLRRIRQLGLSFMVYPGANHTRFEHAMGAMHLMTSALSALKGKGHDITDEEAEAVTIAILLHDIGHGPFSHVLENSIVEGVSHEDLSTLYLEELNREFDGRLSMALDIFRDNYPKRFLHQLVSSQLDMDRLDYLRRDCFYTGVTEGVIGSDRIIEMLTVRNDQLVIEAKGIYSIEKFLIARRLMYWQVYLHKTVIAAESLLVNTLRRARELVLQGETVFASPALSYFLSNDCTLEDFKGDLKLNRENPLSIFAKLDDYDIISAIKVWQDHPDYILSLLSYSLVNRNLFKIKMRSQTFSDAKIEDLTQRVLETFPITAEQIKYFLIQGSITNSALSDNSDNIQILFKNGKVSDIRDASDINLSVLAKTVRKHYLCYPREVNNK